MTKIADSFLALRRAIASAGLDPDRVALDLDDGAAGDALLARIHRENPLAPIRDDVTWPAHFTFDERPYCEIEISGIAVRWPA